MRLYQRSNIPMTPTTAPGNDEGNAQAVPGSKFYFCFTLDTEPDDLWEPFTGLRFEHFKRLFAFHQSLAERGARPVYLTTSEVADDPEAAPVLEKILATGQAELGAHFHTWTRTWPFEVPALGAPPLQALAHQLGQPLEEKMLHYTCDTLERVFGIRPQSYRGGCWSFNPHSVRSLRNCGIAVDTTVTPGKTWHDSQHVLLDGPDFRHFPRHPFYWQVDSAEWKNDSGAVLEFPVGASFVPPGWLGSLRNPIGKLARRFATALGKPHSWLWLRPTLMTQSRLSACLRLLRDDNIPVWVAMIHSSEIIPSHKLPTEEAVKRFIQRCLQLVEDAVELGATCVTLTEAKLLYERTLSIRSPDILRH
jgi:hypothetical protein